MSVNVVILAAGQGTRMNSDRPKVLHEIASAPLLVHAMRAGLALAPDRLIVVGGVGFDAVSKAASAYWPETTVVRQEEQKGTGHAVLCAAGALEGAQGDTLVLYGDTPFISEDTLARMAEARGRADIVVLGFESRPEERYGRLVTEGDSLQRIVEWKDADAATRAITLHNSGVVMADTATLLRLLPLVGTANAAGEIYLTDIVEIGRTQGLTASVVTCPEAETMGINTRAHLAEAEAAFQARARAALVEDGVTLTNPDSIILAFDSFIGRDAVVEGPCVFGPGVTVETGARIRPFCHLEGCHISRGAIIGPFARLRPGAELAEDVHIGNFVEVKNAVVDEGAKINHLSYIGDADVGERTNIGAGTITCNYDGVFKHRTTIGKRAFIGSDTMLVAPVTIGDDAMTATGSVITADVPPGALAVARARQEVKPGFATRFFDRLRALKARKG
jgi:bifunctional UDP-N-acetylglucosamine pyrophosphorylase/glucosamine-1-phosphate N-acetyltransferase